VTYSRQKQFRLVFKLKKEILNDVSFVITNINEVLNINDSVLLIAYFGVYLFAIQSDSFLSLCKEATNAL